MAKGSSAVHLAVGRGSAGDGAAGGISDSEWEFRGRNLKVSHSVSAFQIHFFLPMYFKQHFLKPQHRGIGDRFCPDKLELGIGVRLPQVNPLHFTLKYILLNTFVFQCDQWFLSIAGKMRLCPQGGFIFLFFNFGFL